MHRSFRQYCWAFVKHCWKTPQFYVAMAFFGGPGFISLANSQWAWYWSVVYIVGMYLFLMLFASLHCWMEQRQREHKVKNGEPKQS